MIINFFIEVWATAKFLLEIEKKPAELINNKGRENGKSQLSKRHSKRKKKSVFIRSIFLAGFSLSFYRSNVLISAFFSSRYLCLLLGPDSEFA